MHILRTSYLFFTATFLLMFAGKGADVAVPVQPPAQQAPVQSHFVPSEELLKDFKTDAQADLVAPYQKYDNAQSKNTFGLRDGYRNAFLANAAADKAVYQAIAKQINFLHAGLSPAEKQIFINAAFMQFKQNPEHPSNALLAAQHAIEMAQVKHDMNPSLWRKTVLATQEKILQPISILNAEHSSEINALARAAVVGSAAAFIANKMGYTEWVKNKIREAFAKPTIYTIQRRSKGLFGRKKQKLIGLDDLVLAPKTDKQVKELIWLTRRRYETLKTTKKPPTPFDHVLLYGPPGTGKSSIAQMIADQSLGDDGQPMKMIRLMASDFMQIKKEGDRIAVLKDMFAEARRIGNCIIFLDEIDGMVAQRGKENEGSNRAFLDHLLEEMAVPSTRFFVIGATNHFDKIDKALISRFRRKLPVGLPTEPQRKKILDKKIEQELLPRGFTSLLDTKQLAAQLNGDAGRDLDALITRIRDRIEYEHGTVATPEIAQTILREMEKIPGLVSADDDDDPVPITA